MKLRFYRVKYNCGHPGRVALDGDKGTHLEKIMEIEDHHICFACETKEQIKSLQRRCPKCP